MRTISMQDLQKLSAGAIKALPHAVPVKDGADTIAVLLPINNSRQEYLKTVFAQIDAAVAKYTPEEKAAIERLLAERGID